MWGSFRRKTGHIFCPERAECSKSLNGEEIQKKNSVMAIMNMMLHLMFVLYEFIYLHSKDINF